MRAAGRCDLRVVRDEAGLIGLKDEWDDLAGRCGAAGGFCDHVFAVQSWRRHRDDAGKSLHVVTIRQGGALVLVMPMIMRRGRLGISRLDWLDSGTPLYDSILLDADADRDAVTQGLRRHLRSLRFCRRLKARFVPAGSPLERLLVDLGATREPHMTAHALDLSEYRDWEDFLARKSSNFRQGYFRLARQLEARGCTGPQRIEDGARMREQIAWIFARKRQWVVDRFGAENWISPPGAEAFFQASAGELAARGQAYALRLAIGGETAAAALTLRDGDTIRFTKFAYDPRWRALSPGWLLVLEAVRLAFADGIARVDFMTGEDAWKDRLANRQTAIMTCRLPLGVFARASRAR